MINSKQQVKQALTDKGFTAEDADLMTEEVKDFSDKVYKIERENSKSNTLLGLFCWSSSSQGSEFWTRKFNELEKQEKEGGAR